MAAAENICCETFDKIDEIIARKGSTPDSLIEVLHGVQEELGYLPQAVQEYVAGKLGLPVGAVEGVITFYSFFTTVPRGRHSIKVCQGTACYVRGGKRVLEAVARRTAYLAMLVERPIILSQLVRLTGMSPWIGQQIVRQPLLLDELIDTRRLYSPLRRVELEAELDALQAELDAVSASLTELAEEHGGDEDALKDVSTKGDAQEAYTQALVAVWNEEDKAACDKYSALIDEAEEHAAELRKLTDHHHISVLKNSRGNLTLKAIKDRLASTGDKIEQKTLNKYLDADKQQKAKTKEASELLASTMRLG